MIQKEYWISKVEECNISRNPFVTWEAVAKEWIAIFSKLSHVEVDPDIVAQADMSIDWFRSTFNCKNTNLSDLNGK